MFSPRGNAVVRRLGRSRHTHTLTFRPRILGFCYGLFKHLRRAGVGCASSPYPAALQKEFYGFYGLEVKSQKKQSNRFYYTFHAKDGHLSKRRVAPADWRWFKKGRKGPKLYAGPFNSLGPDALATTLHREERERLHAELRVQSGLEPKFVYNFPRDPLECLLSLEHAFAEATDMVRRFEAGLLLCVIFFDVVCTSDLPRFLCCRNVSRRRLPRR